MVGKHADGNGVNKGPAVEHMRRVVGLFSALATGARASIPELTDGMTLEQGALACFAVGELLMRKLVDLSGKSIEDVAAQLTLEFG
jgi:hypothetical protein